MYIKYRNSTVYYEKTGDKKNTILILPGWGNTRKTFQEIIENLKENYTIYSIDYPSFGNSPILKEEWTIYDYAEMIKKLLEKEKITNPIIIAHSFGGRIVSILQGYYKIPIQKIILMNVAGIRRKKITHYIKEKLYKFLKKICILFHQKKLLIKLQNSFSSSDYQECSWMMRKTFQNIVKEDLKKYYKKIESEVLILWGEKDTSTPVKDAYLLNKIIKYSGLIIFKNTSHFSYLERSYQTIQILKEFLKKEDVD